MCHRYHTGALISNKEFALQRSFGLSPGLMVSAVVQTSHLDAVIQSSASCVLSLNYCVMQFSAVSKFSMECTIPIEQSRPNFCNESRQQCHLKLLFAAEITSTNRELPPSWCPKSWYVIVVSSKSAQLLT